VVFVLKPSFYVHAAQYEMHSWHFYVSMFLSGKLVVQTESGKNCILYSLPGGEEWRIKLAPAASSNEPPPRVGKP
jgi:hypothetical protein